MPCHAPVCCHDNSTHADEAHIMLWRHRRYDYYFQCTVVNNGDAVHAAHALILYALIALKQHKKHLISDIQPKCIRSVSTPCCLVETARRRNIILKQEECSKYLGVNYN